MQKVARYLKLNCVKDTSCKFKWLAKFLNRFILSGYLRGHFIKIYNLVTHKQNIISQSVASIQLNNHNVDQITIRSKRNIGLLKIFGKTFFKTNDIILDKYLIIEAKNFPPSIQKLFTFDEITAKMSELWSSKYNRGILEIGNNHVTYFEPNGLWTIKKRKRFVIVAHLLCDIADYLSLPIESCM